MLLAALKKYGALGVSILLTGLTTILSAFLTSIALAIFQGYVDMLGIIISIVVPALIMPVPLRTFFHVVLKLDTAEATLIKKNKALESALNEVKQLSGLLPMCAHCKRIRDDTGYWNEVEEYIRSHSEAVFSHSFCPDCAEMFYGKYKRG